MVNKIADQSNFLNQWRIFTDLDIIITESEAAETNNVEQTWSCGGGSYCMEDYTIYDGKEMPRDPDVQIQQAVVGVRLPRAQVVVIRRAF